MGTFTRSLTSSANVISIDLAFVRIEELVAFFSFLCHSDVMNLKERNECSMFSFFPLEKNHLFSQPDAITSILA